MQTPQDLIKPLYQALEAGPPAIWVARFGLPIGGALLDSGLDPNADYAHMDALALTPRETFTLEGSARRSTHMNETPVNETPVNEASINETSINETPVNETPVNETPVNATSAKENKVTIQESRAAPNTMRALDPYLALERWNERPWLTESGAVITAEAWEELGAELELPLPMTMCAISYELGAERYGVTPHDRPHPAPQLWAARYAAVYVWCRRRHRGFVVGESARAVEELSEALSAPLAEQRSSGEHPLARASHNPWLNQEESLIEGSLRPHMGWPAYQVAIKEAHDRLQSGDLYQINLTLPMTAKLRSDVTLEEVFVRLREVNSGQFSALFRFDEERAVISLSPERLMRWGAPHPTRVGRLIETAPIKGTRPRHANPELDRAEAEALSASEKDQAEHVMILDLERNDLGRVCETGSVEVVSDRELKSYATVHHLVSVVRGALRDDVTLSELLGALFPGGSVTGAPKRRALEQIRELEVGPRGLYCGALGYLDPRGRGDLNIPIRTALIHEGRLIYHAGGGVVVDSTARAEWEEIWVKTRGVQRGLGEQR